MELFNVPAYEDIMDGLFREALEDGPLSWSVFYDGSFSNLFEGEFFLSIEFLIVFDLDRGLFSSA